MSKKSGDTLTTEQILEWTKKRDPGETEFHQAVHEVMESVVPWVGDHKKYQNPELFRQLTEPERVIMFQVPWHDDNGNIQVNRGFRIQFNSALGPYKGGLRFHPTVNLSVLKFLAFEQIFKNSLTGLPLGGGKGGSDFNPRGRSENEIMRFCQSFMSELFHYIGPETDIPAGDIGVGSREIGYLFGQYKRLNHSFSGVLTGKGLAYGGSELRMQSTGYGVLYFIEEMMKQKSDSVEGKTVVISGSGNVAQFACEKALEMGAKVISVSDSDGFIVDKGGIDEEKLEFIKTLKNEKRGRMKEYADEFGCDYHEGKPWKLACDIAIPCATQNEVDEYDAKTLIDNGLKIITEGANMPCNDGAVRVFQKAGVSFAPGKASNAGGVSVSGLEMSQNALRMSWPAVEVDKKLKDIMREIHEKCNTYGEEKNGINYVKGANIAGFIKVADAMLAQGG